jgi:DNA repair protein RadB
MEQEADNEVKKTYRTAQHHSNKLPSGSEVFDTLLSGGYEKDIVTTIYGPAGTGKTCFCLLAAIQSVKKGGKVIYVDTEGGFSTERFTQLTPEYKLLLKNIVLYKPTSFTEQIEVFEKLRESLRENCGLIIIDSVAMLYRLELGQTTNIYELNRELGRQLAYLTEIARKKNVPILITNQVYASFEETEKNKVNMVGGDILKYGSKSLIELSLVDTPTNLTIRRATIKKHRSLAQDLYIEYKIVNEGIIELKQ